MLLSESDEDFNVGVALCEFHSIKPSRLFHGNWKGSEDCKYVFKMNFGKLIRREKNSGYQMFMKCPPGIFLKDFNIRIK